MDKNLNYYKYKKYKKKYIFLKNKILLKGGEINSSKLSFINSEFEPTTNAPKNDSIKGIIVPHAGLAYSGQIADEVYKQIDFSKYEKILLLSTNHYDQNNSYIPESTFFTLNSKQYNFEIIDNDNISKSDEKFNNEHSWIVQLPFIDETKNIIPILVGNNYQSYQYDIFKLIDDKTLVIANTDLLHCGGENEEKCVNIDEENYKTICNIKDFKLDETNKLCGRNAISLFNYIASKKNWNFEQKFYTTSDKISNSSRSVGYVSMIFTPNEKKNIMECNLDELIKIPRIVYKELFKTEESDIESTFVNYNKIYEVPYGIFVTIEEKVTNKLRGCVGTFKLKSNLEMSIIIQTYKSIFNDSRFNNNKLEENDLEHIKFKINFLSKPFEIWSNESQNAENVIQEKLIVGLHGITLYFGGNSATYLAKVLVENFKIPEGQQISTEKWNELKRELAEKSGGNIENLSKIELYECKEYSEQ